MSHFYKFLALFLISTKFHCSDLENRGNICGSEQVHPVKKIMCVYHYEDSKRAERWILLLLMGSLFFSLGVSIPMFILTYPGDECLLFVSVRGEALIYGNPAGCNFLSYGHCVLTLFSVLVLGLIFCRPRKGVLRRQKPKEVGSTRSLRGSTLNGGGHYAVQSECDSTVTEFGISRFYSTKAIAISAFSAIFALITAFVIISGYLVTCNELQYESRRQVLGKITLGKKMGPLTLFLMLIFYLKIVLPIMSMLLKFM